MHLGNNLTAIQLLASEYRSLTHYASKQLHQLITNYISLKRTENSNTKPLSQLIITSKHDLFTMKRKLSQKFEQHYRLYDTVHKRSKHTKQKSYSDPEREEEFNMEVLQYLHSRRKFSLVKPVTESFTYEELVAVQTTLLAQAENIMKQIRMNYLVSLLAWMEKNHHQLQKLNLVYFQLTICQYLNILREGKLIEAIILLRNYIQTMRPSEAQYRIIESMTYLLADMESNPPDFKLYLKLLEDAFLRAFSEIYHLNFQQTLTPKVVQGISSKSTICCCPASNCKIFDCAICSQRPQHLATKIPRLNLSTSVLICRINQSTMDHENYPVSLPSGQIYSISGLRSTSRENRFYCMITETWYNKEEAVKIYLT